MSGGLQQWNLPSNGSSQSRKYSVGLGSKLVLVYGLGGSSGLDWCCLGH